MFNLDKVHIILDEIILNGHIVETNKNRILAPLLALDKMAEGWMTQLHIGEVDYYHEHALFKYPAPTTASHMLIDLYKY